MAQNEDYNTNANGTAFIVDKAGMYTWKAEHKFTDKWSLSGLYIYNKTDEPGSTIMKPDKLFMADQDQWFGPLRRRPHVLVFNNTNVLNNTTVLTLRYGWTTWQDSCDKQAFTPGIQSLGFSPTYVNALGPGGKDTFPSISFPDGDVESVGGWGGIPVRWKGPYAINGALTKLFGSHSVKIGADFRKLGVSLSTASECPNEEPALGGCFQFDRRFTSRNGVGGDPIASLLLGLPFTGSAPANPGLGEWYTRYWGGYVQDDWRVTSKFTLNYGIRLEHEDGLREVDNQQTVAFDQNVTNPIDAFVPKTGLLAGRTLKGGLIYAGVNGAPTEQGNPKKIKPAPRVGATYAIDANTVLRGGYGLYWAPWNYNTSQHGQIGATGRDISFCGTNDCSININQIDPALARQMFPLGSGWDAGALRQSIPNPFFGIAQAGELGTSPTIQRGQLLRPFPEFGNVLMHESTAGSKRQYNALSVELDKRVGAGTWGGRLSYTY